jgi:hypothetical protein
LSLAEYTRAYLLYFFASWFLGGEIGAPGLHTMYLVDQVIDRNEMLLLPVFCKNVNKPYPATHGWADARRRLKEGELKGNPTEAQVLEVGDSIVQKLAETDGNVR